MQSAAGLCSRQNLLWLPTFIRLDKSFGHQTLNVATWCYGSRLIKRKSRSCRELLLYWQIHQRPFPPTAVVTGKISFEKTLICASVVAPVLIGGQERKCCRQGYNKDIPFPSRTFCSRYTLSRSWMMTNPLLFLTWHFLIIRTSHAGLVVWCHMQHTSWWTGARLVFPSCGCYCRIGKAQHPERHILHRTSTMWIITTALPHSPCTSSVSWPFGPALVGSALINRSCACTFETTTHIGNICDMLMFQQAKSPIQHFLFLCLDFLTPSSFILCFHAQFVIISCSFIMTSCSLSSFLVHLSSDLGIAHSIFWQKVLPSTLHNRKSQCPFMSDLLVFFLLAC